MNIKGFRRMLLGEKMPDRNDPKYKERYEREVNAGRRFAKATRIDKAAAKVQGFDELMEKFARPVFQMQTVSDGKAHQNRQHDCRHAGRLDDRIDANRNGAVTEQGRQIIFQVLR